MSRQVYWAIYAFYWENFGFWRWAQQGRRDIEQFILNHYFLPPRNTLAGRVMIALSDSKTAVTVIPRSLKGKVRSHTRGYSSKANRARGQHKTSRISQRRNFAIEDPPCCGHIMSSFYVIEIRDSLYSNIIYTKIIKKKSIFFLLIYRRKSLEVILRRLRKGVPALTIPILGRSERSALSFSWNLRPWRRIKDCSRTWLLAVP